MMTRTRANAIATEKKMKDQAKQDEKRRRTMFQPKTSKDTSGIVIGPNDIVVNMDLGKVKLETDVDTKPLVSVVADGSVVGTSQAGSSTDGQNVVVTEVVEEVHVTALEDTGENVYTLAEVKCEYEEPEPDLEDNCYGVEPTIIPEAPQQTPFVSSVCSKSPNPNHTRETREPHREDSGGLIQEQVIISTVFGASDPPVSSLMDVEIVEHLNYRINELEKEVEFLRRNTEKEEKNSGTTSNQKESVQIQQFIDRVTALEMENQYLRGQIPGTMDGNKKSGKENDSGTTSNTSHECSRTSVDPVEQKVMELFPQVLKVYWNSFARHQESKLQYISKLPYVCKAWRAGMDQLLASSENSPFANCVKVHLHNGQVNSVEEEKNRVFQIFQNTHKGLWSIIQPRELIIEDTTEEPSFANVANCKTFIMEFLEQFGSSIHFFSHLGTSQPQNLYSPIASEWYATFRRWILFMPNLKAITVRSNFHYNDGTISERELEEMNQHPFPRMEHLTSLKLFGNTRFDPVHLALLNANVHIETISLTGTGLPPDLVTSFPNLRRVEYVVGDQCYDFSWLSSLGSLVTTLEIDGSSTNIWNSFKIWNSMNSFTSLEHLKVSFFLPWITCPPMHLPNLKTLTLRNHWRWENKQLRAFDKMLEVISQLQSLESVELRIWKEEVMFAGCKDPEKVPLAEIKKIIGIDFVNKIWEVLPGLKQVLIETNCKPGGWQTLLFIRRKFICHL